MKPSLVSPWLKLHRAEEHLTELAAAMTAASREPYFEAERRIERDWIVIVARKVRSPPESWALMAGDVVHNLRSALDHLAYQLILLNGQTPKRSSFPLYMSTPRDPGSFDRATQGMSQRHRDAIWKLQPFHQEGRHTPSSVLLGMVGDMDNLDKHRLVPPTIYSQIHGQAYGSGQGIAEVRQGETEIREGTELVRMRTLSGNAEANVPFTAVVGFFGLPALTVGVLNNAALRVSGVLQSFAADFEQARGAADS